MSLLVLGLVIAYVAGSFPTAYLMGRVLKGIDLRTVGSGNLGATNVYRALGLGPAVAVFAIDAAKGFLPVAFLPRALGASTTMEVTVWALAYGVFSIGGHAKPIFLLWKGGGKGVSTAAGVFAAAAPVPLALALTVFTIVTLVSGYVSLGSLVAAPVLCVVVAVYLGVGPVFWVSVALAVFIYWSHRANIGRLRAGTESSIRKTRTPGATP
ncbi:MAG: glycerol-3-phosphate 1-O-acyltransferase PlsY [Gemmatimonadetes bacterium]|nr:glycerol-3-phosphate 1-O-acyltransferase PlsY [Gemmatimonadota bacterium]